MTATAAVDYPASGDAYDGPMCWRCGGPCWQWKGTVHGWTCGACIDRYLDESAAKGAERDRRDREKLARKRLDAPDDLSPRMSGRASG